MKLLSSGWVLAILAAVLNIGTTGGLIYMERDSILQKATGAGGKDALPRFWSFRADEVDALIAELKTERDKLDARQTELDRLGAHIEAERQELEKTRADVVAMQDEITAQIPQIQDAERKNLKTLAVTYSGITPTAVVAIFREMDEMTCVKLLSQMKPDKVAAILQEMSQEDKDQSMTKRAARISDKLRLILAQPKPQA
jgi:flagellar motility protein MotE (MotC chaperone)